MIINDGSGKGHSARVNGNQQLGVRGTAETPVEEAALAGRLFNLNTGTIDLSATGVGTLLYFKNAESADKLIVKNLIIGVGTVGGSPTDPPEVTVLRNPTAGNLISDATAATANANADFNSGLTLSSLFYKGKDAGTISGGATFDYQYAAGGARTILEVNVVLGLGDSIAVSLDCKSASGANAYAGLTVYRLNGEA